MGISPTEPQIITARPAELDFLVLNNEIDCACAVIKEAMDGDPELVERGLDVPPTMWIFTYGSNWSDVA